MTPQEKSKVIFEALFPDEHWSVLSEQTPETPNRNWTPSCVVCGKEHPNPNYFDPKLPDDERVKLVEAAHLLYSDKFNEALRNGAGSFFGVSTTIALLPGAAIAEAIYRLITEEKR